MSTATIPVVTLEVDDAIRRRPEFLEALSQAQHYASRLIHDTTPTLADDVCMSIRAVPPAESPWQNDAVAAFRLTLTAGGPYPAEGGSGVEPVASLLDPRDLGALIRRVWGDVLTAKFRTIGNSIRRMDLEGYEELPNG